MKYLIEDFGENNSLGKFLTEKKADIFYVKPNPEKPYMFDINEILEFCNKDKEDIFLNVSKPIAVAISNNSDLLPYLKYWNFEHYPHFGNLMLNYPYSIVRNMELRQKEMLNSLLRNHSVDGRMFVKSIFLGDSLRPSIYDIRNPTNHYGGDFVLVSEPKEILSEFRVWINQEKIIHIAMCKPIMMKYDVEFNPIKDFVNKLLHRFDYGLDRTTINIAHLGNDEYRVVDITPIECSEFYNFDFNRLEELYDTRE